ncbi:MAG: SDR family oxidoreductase [Alphaproteobacteria bacterium]|nr:SDR family oxidoreductase [Alphaproteobacteria bacterium]MCB9690743.1 SDR family oxidoreductase [Alphaproteobacteria bacterium]
MAREWIAILGASSGFGAATARAFAAAGYGVFGVHLDRRSTMPAVEALIAELEGHGVPVLFHNGNAASDEEMAAALDALRERMEPDDRVGVLLHSLAFGTLRPFFVDDGKPLTRKQLDMTLDVMANTLVYWSQALVQRELLREGGRIFAMTSSGSLAAWQAYGAVSAAKCALESHVRQLAVELAPRRITANAIMAGVTHTAALEKIPGADEISRRALERNPSGRLTVPEDVATCLVALSGPGTSWMTGNIIRVDGGESVAG